MSLDEEVVKQRTEGMFQERTEMGAVFENLDDMKSIDVNARLSDIEIKHIKVIDELTNMGILPHTIGICKQTKALSVSKDGKGRIEKVQIASAKMGETIAGGQSFLSRLVTPRQ